MKTYCCLLLAMSAMVGTSYGCANQAVYDLCLKTGEAALGACGPAGSNAKCACAAQKQILACYSECPDDATIFELGKIQAGQVQVFCSMPGAEGPVTNVLPTDIMIPTSVISPIHASATASQAAVTGSPAKDSQKDMNASASAAAANPQPSAQKSSAGRRAVWDCSMAAILGVSIYILL